MKKILSILSITLMCLVNASAQSTLPLRVYVEDLVQPFPANAKMQVVNKLNQMLTSNGLGSNDAFSDFVLTVVANPVDKVVVPGAPVKVMQSVDFSFYVVDANRKVIFSTYSVEAKGVGDSEVKSCLDAVKRINVKNKEVSSFLDEGRRKIVAYFEKEASNIFAKAKVLASQRKYDEALYTLCGFPTDCSKYKASLELGSEIYKQYCDYTSQLNLNMAKAAWAASQNASGAAEAGEYLAEILPDAACYPEAQNLYKEIKAKVLDDWKFEMKKYQDGVDLESQRIKAWQEVGVAYGKNQQQTTTNLAWLK